MACFCGRKHFVREGSGIKRDTGFKDKCRTLDTDTIHVHIFWKEFNFSLVTFFDLFKQKLFNFIGEINYELSRTFWNFTLYISINFTFEWKSVKNERKKSSQLILSQNMKHDEQAKLIRSLYFTYKFETLSTHHTRKCAAAMNVSSGGKKSEWKLFALLQF